MTDRKAEIIAITERIGRFYDMGARWTILAGMAGHESRHPKTLIWGASEIAVKLNNFFGYKWPGSSCNRPYEHMDSNEEDAKGAIKLVKSKFIKYPSLENSVDHMARTLMFSGNYFSFRRMLDSGESDELLLREIARVHATDSGYAGKVKLRIAEIDKLRGGVVA